MMRSIQTLLGLLLLSGSLSAAPPNYDDAPLHAIQFVDEHEGWAVGADGLILHSIDGGKNWERQASGTTARLNDVHFATPYIGWVAGEIALDSDIGTGGIILATANGGANWFELSRNTLPGLSNIQFRDVKTGIVTVPGTPQGTLHATTDGGISWQNAGPAPKPPAFVKELEQNHGRFPNFCQFKDKLWAVGRPGSIIFHSTDAGKTWSKQSTPIRNPLHAVQFLNETTGWAVGDFGTILNSNDGGKTWTVQRGGSHRAAILGLFAEPAGMPTGTVAKLGGTDGYQTVLLNAAPSANAALSMVNRDLGAAATDNLSQSEWPDYMREPPAKDEPKLLPTVRNNDLLAEMVLAIRIWQPDVILTDRFDSSTTIAEKVMLLHAREAFDKAGDAAAFPEQLTQFGLQPHRASKLYAQTDSETDAGVSIAVNPTNSELLRQTASFTQAEPRTVERFRLLAHRLDDATGTDLMSGITLAPGTPGRRVVDEPAAEVAVTDDRFEKEIATLKQRHATASITADDLKATAEKIADRPDAEAARMAGKIAQELETMGAWTAAREMHAMVANRYTAQPGAVESIRWLLNYHTSGELVRRIENGEFPIYQEEIFAQLPEPKIVQASHTNSPNVNRSIVLSAR